MAERIGSILPSRLRHYQVQGAVTSAQIVTQFNEVANRILPQHIASRMRGISVREGMLFCEVDHPAVAQECKFREREMIAELKKKIPQSPVTRIRFRLQTRYE